MMNEQLELIDCPADNAGQLQDIWCQTYAQELGFAAADDLLLSLQWQGKVQQYDAAHTEQRKLLIQVNTEVVGYIWLGINLEQVSIIDFAILPEYQGRGLGTKALNALFVLLQGAVAVFRLSVIKSNPAVKLYHKHGFTSFDEDDVYVYMQRTLTEA